MTDRLFHIFNHLIFFPLMFAGFIAYAQPDNETVLRNILSQYLETPGLKFREYQGFTNADYLPDLVADTLSSRTLAIGNPRVSYKQVEKKSYLRRLEVRLKIIGEMPVDTTIFYSDTLSGKVLRQINRKSPEFLHTEDPTLMGKWVKPLAIIAVSVGGVISLFYIRSSL
ncbi:MAG: hypothetical protein R3D00_01330 [Bacteroidia bacterium]